MCSFVKAGTIEAPCEGKLKKIKVVMHCRGSLIDVNANENTLVGATSQRMNAGLPRVNTCLTQESQATSPVIV